ncbi:MAG: nucleotidyltransferase family protein [Dehalococcoidia bacterium]|nr:nucleotidyltransferase family protein [Dehalococcoidia bacterium]
MTELEKVKEKIKGDMPYLKKKYKVKAMGIFGSYVRGENGVDSDLDILVEFDDPPTLLEFIALERHVTELTGRKVDLVMKTALKPRIGEHILEEVVYV